MPKWKQSSQLQTVHCTDGKNSFKESNNQKRQAKWDMTSNNNNNKNNNQNKRSRKRAQKESFFLQRKKNKQFILTWSWPKKKKKMQPQIINEYEKKNWSELKSRKLVHCVLFYRISLLILLLLLFCCWFRIVCVWRQQRKAVYRNFLNIYSQSNRRERTDSFHPERNNT